jgi:hypothetical protein
MFSTLEENIGVVAPLAAPVKDTLEFDEEGGGTAGVVLVLELERFERATCEGGVVVAKLVVCAVCVRAVVALFVTVAV